MLKEFLSQRPVQVALALVVIIGISGVLYLNHVKTETQRDIANMEVETPKRETSPASPSGTPDPATQGGHWHADGTYHPDPHAEAVESGTPTRSKPATTSVEKQTVLPVQPFAPPETEPVKLDPETQARVDALYEQADTLSKEADMWSNKLYAESHAFHKENEAIRAETEKEREMLRDPNVDKETLKAFQEALDARARAVNAEGIRRHNLYIQNRSRREEVMRLIREARQLQGIE